MPTEIELHKVAYKGGYDGLERIGEILDETPDVINAKGAQNRTPLHRAVSKGHNDIVRLLIERKADVSLADAGGLTALHYSALFSLVDTAGIIVEHHPDVNVKTKAGETALHFSAEKGNPDFIQFLIDHGADLEIRDNNLSEGELGRTAYDAAKEAIKQGHPGKHKECLPLLKPPSYKNAGCCVMM